MFMNDQVFPAGIGRQAARSTWQPPGDYAVEPEQQLDSLRSLGCDGTQGFLYSAALPAEQFTELLREGKCLPHHSSAQ